jgi:hypothetical protein
MGTSSSEPICALQLVSVFGKYSPERVFPFHVLTSTPIYSVRPRSQQSFAACPESTAVPLKKFIISDEDFEIHHIPFKKSNGNSDHKSFPCGVGVVASRKGKLFKFVTGRIHTERDTVAESKNVRFLAEKMRQFIKEL